ncbi:MAG: cation-translocating P-type ATPase, partial [Promethearchaeota archaeon]
MVDIQDMKNYVFMGTYVTKGNARAVVVAAGANTEIGMISKELSEVSGHEIPLKRKINNFAKYLGILVGIMFLINLIYKVIYRTNTGEINNSEIVIRDLIKSIDLGLKFIPINIVLLVTIILITGVLAMAKKGVIVRNLTSVEALGRVSVVCTDKTGTLTRNEMTIKHVYTDNKVFDVTGVGYTSEGSVLLDGKEIDLKDHKALELLAISGLMNNNAEIVEEEFKITGKGEKTKIVRRVIGDPMEAALDLLAEKLKISEEKLLEEYKFIKEFPFDSELKRMMKIWAPVNGGDWVCYSKGATELILFLSKNIYENGKEVPLTDARKEEIINKISYWAEKGFRTLGLAIKKIKPVPEGQELDRESIEKDMTFLGFVMIMDPPREGVKEAVEACESAGVTVVIITGDHPKTAKAIGRELGIYSEDEKIVEGKELANLAYDEFMRTAVFARVAPDDKEIIVGRYQKEGNKVVAMTGDGVNDSLALGMADVGIAMGITGTDIAKEAADMIISDDSFNTIERGIREGRGLFSRIRIIIYFFVYANLAEAIVLFSVSFIHPDFALFDLTIQIQLIYLVAHSLPPLALTFDRTSIDIMKEEPRDEEEIFNKNTLLLMIVNVIVLLVALLIPSVWIVNSYFQNIDLVQSGESLENIIELNRRMAKPRTIALGVIYVIEILTIFSFRRPNIPIWKSFRKDMSPFLIVMMILSFLGFIAVVYLPVDIVLRRVGPDFQLYLAPLSWEDWLLILAIGLPSIPILEFIKFYVLKGRFMFKIGKKVIYKKPEWF